jgi:hypothetical protein
LSKNNPDPEGSDPPIWPEKAPVFRQKKLHESFESRTIHAAFILSITLTQIGGDDRDRTGDPLLAKQVLSQLSYIPSA